MNNINVAPYTRPVRTVQWEGQKLKLFLYPIIYIIYSRINNVILPKYNIKEKNMKKIKIVLDFINSL